eukprot:TRINITY_DN17325_c0_g1_i2.p1 TRINITY_DN17325_c0_g1~~TRINITY_DN17325_c0_g1_i2.p1  ORF type:complete len:1164 (+),score=426.14 TRINITY_DN17325_c0_g1_i2:197-3688(+)
MCIRDRMQDETRRLEDGEQAAGAALEKARAKQDQASAAVDKRERDLQAAQTRLEQGYDVEIGKAAREQASGTVAGAEQTEAVELKAVRDEMARKQQAIDQDQESREARRERLATVRVTDEAVKIEKVAEIQAAAMAKQSKRQQDKLELETEVQLTRAKHHADRTQKEFVARQKRQQTDETQSAQLAATQLQDAARRGCTSPACLRNKKRLKRKSMQRKSMQRKSMQRKSMQHELLQEARLQIGDTVELLSLELSPADVFIVQPGAHSSNINGHARRSELVQNATRSLQQAQRQLEADKKLQLRARAYFQRVQQRFGEAEAAANGQRMLVDLLQQKITTTENSKVAQQTAADAADSALRKHRAAWDAQRAAVQVAEQRLGTSEQALEAAHQQLVLAEAQFKEAKRKVGEGQRSQQKAGSSQAALAAEASQLETLVNQARTEQREHERDMRDLAARAKAKADQLHQDGARATEADQACRDAKHALQLAQRNLDTVSDKVSDMAERIRKTGKQVEASQAKAKQALAKLSSEREIAAHLAAEFELFKIQNVSLSSLTLAQTQLAMLTKELQQDQLDLSKEGSSLAVISQAKARAETALARDTQAQNVSEHRLNQRTVRTNAARTKFDQASAELESRIQEDAEKEQELQEERDRRHKAQAVLDATKLSWEQAKAAAASAESQYKKSRAELTKAQEELARDQRVVAERKQLVEHGEEGLEEAGQAQGHEEQAVKAANTAKAHALREVESGENALDAARRELGAGSHEVERARGAGTKAKLDGDARLVPLESELEHVQEKAGKIGVRAEQARAEARAAEDGLKSAESRERAKSEALVAARNGMVVAEQGSARSADQLNTQQAKLLEGRVQLEMENKTWSLQHTEYRQVMSRLADLQAEHSAASADEHTLLNRLEQTETQRQTKVDQLKSKQLSAEHAVKQIDQLRAEAAHLRSQIAPFQTQMSDHIKELRVQVQSSARAHEAAELSSTAPREQRDALAAHLQKLSNVNSKLGQIDSDAKSLLGRGTSKLERLSERADAAQRAQQEAKDDMGVKLHALSEADGRVSVLEKEVEQAGPAVVESKDQADQIGQTVTAKAVELEGAEDSMRDSGEKLDQLRTKLRETQRRLDSTRFKANAAASQYDAQAEHAKSARMLVRKQFDQDMQHLTKRK